MTEHIKRLCGCLVAAATVLAAPLAGAAAGQSSASMTGFTITLIDLNPDDGIAPAVTYKTDSMVSWSQRSNGPAAVVDWKAGASSTEVRQQSGWAQTTTDARSAVARAESLDDTSQFLAWSTRTMNFELTPWTAIAFSGLAQVESTVRGSRLTDGTVAMWGNLYNEAVGGEDRFPLSSFEYELNSARRPGVQALVGLLQSGATTGYGDFNLRAIAEANVIPVPEPSTYAMLLAGLGLVGWAGRRAANT